MATATTVDPEMGQLVAFFQDIRPHLNRATVGASHATLTRRVDQTLASCAERGIKPVPWRGRQAPERSAA